MKKRLDVAINPLIVLLEGFILCGKNAIYKAYLIAARIIETAVQGLSLEALYQLNKCLSADRMLEKVHSFTEEQVKQIINKGTKLLELPKKVILAIDFHEKEYYGDKKHLQVIGSKGGKYVQRFIELSIVKPALFINALMVDQFTNNKLKLLTQLIDGFNALYNKTKIDLLLLDRAFFTKAVVKYLVENKIKFIMPAVKNRAILPLAEQFRNGWLPERIEYEFGEARIYLVFIQIEDEVLVYATNTKYSPLKTYMLYRKRWQIETNFREQNQFLVKTTTRNFIGRYLLFALAGLLFNAWQLKRVRSNNLRGYVFRKAIEKALEFCWLPYMHRERG